MVKIISTVPRVMYMVDKCRATRARKLYNALFVTCSMAMLELDVSRILKSTGMLQYGRYPLYYSSVDLGVTTPTVNLVE